MLAALAIASVAAMEAIRPLVSTRPRASLLPLRAMTGILTESSLVGRLAGRDLRGLGQHRVRVLVRARDDLHADDFADAPAGDRAGVDRGLDRGNIAGHKGSDQAA